MCAFGGALDFLWQWPAAKKRVGWGPVIRESRDGMG